MQQQAVARTAFPWVLRPAQAKASGRVDVYTQGWHGSDCRKLLSSATGRASGALLGPRSVARLCPVAVLALVAPLALPCPRLALLRPRERCWPSAHRRRRSPFARLLVHRL